MASPYLPPPPYAAQQNYDEIIQQNMRLRAALGLVKSMLVDVYRVQAGLELRHDGLSCSCPVCHDVREGTEQVRSRTSEILKRVEEAGF